jgi:S-adenosylmethionine:tRNA ribosyltransferase-isomerase
MLTADYDYVLPPDAIAQEPARPRGSSRLLVVDRRSGELEHRSFGDFPGYIGADDVVVFNDTRVGRARLRGRRLPGGGKAEILLLSRRSDAVWEALVMPGRRLQPGRQIEFGESELRAEVIDRTPTGGRLLKFSANGDVDAALARLAEVPLPPYITRPLADEEDYQTVYARRAGATAAPTAGLHFTPEVLAAVRERAHACVSVTLHIGIGTFRPVHAERVEDHQMHGERYAVSEQTAQVLSQSLAEGRRIVVVGTSTARALEAAATPEGAVGHGARETDLFIAPGHRFSVVGALLTNFHMPRSTLLVLVCAFAGRPLILQAYRTALEERYRFLSFGDAMLIV